MESTQPSPTPRFESYPGLPPLRGVNLGNALDAPWPGAWGVTITEAMIQSVAEAGFNAIRLPVRFSAHTGAEPDYTLSESILTSVDQVILLGLDAGLTVVLDLHHFDALMQSPAAEEARFFAIWDQLASRYQSLPDTLYFELLNEPHGVLDSETWNRLVAESVQIIRQANPTRTILIGGLAYSTVDSLNELALPDPGGGLSIITNPSNSPTRVHPGSAGPQAGWAPFGPARRKRFPSSSRPLTGQWIGLMRTKSP